MINFLAIKAVFESYVVTLTILKIPEWAQFIRSDRGALGTYTLLAYFSRLQFLRSDVATCLRRERITRSCDSQDLSERSTIGLSCSNI